MLKNIIIATLSIGAIIGLVLIVNSGLVASERVECIKWQKQNGIFEGYYYTNWQIAQCEAVAPETLR